MSAPTIRILREILEINEQKAAAILSLDKKSYLLKEQGSDNFEWNEIVALYNWIIPQVDLLPADKQKKAQVILEYFPDQLKEQNNDQGKLFDADLPSGITNTTQIKVPVHFMELPGDTTIIDFSGNINLAIVDKIRHTTHFSRYPAFEFNAIVWWHGELGYWAIQIHQMGAYRETLLGVHLDELIKAIRSKYGTR